MGIRDKPLLPAPFQVWAEGVEVGPMPTVGPPHLFVHLLNHLFLCFGGWEPPPPSRGGVCFVLFTNLQTGAVVRGCSRDDVRDR